MIQSKLYTLALLYMGANLRVLKPYSRKHLKLKRSKLLPGRFGPLAAL